jgi:hypothetical protein
MHSRFRLGLVIPGFLVATTSLAQPSPTAQPDTHQRERLAQISLPFVENWAQWDERVAFAVKANFGTVFVTHTGQLVDSLGILSLSMSEVRS